MFPHPRLPQRALSLSRGITLIEILAAMAIAATLVALLVPSLKGVRDGALSAKCESNLRQIGAALVTYRTDNNGQMPYVYNSTTRLYWFHLLLQSGALPDPRVLACPSNTNTSPAFQTTPPTPVGYGMLDASIWYPTTGPAPGRWQDDPRRWMRVREPSDWPLVMDADKWAIYSLDNPATTAAADSRYTARHLNHANVLMLDGHIEKAAPGDTRWRQSVLNDDAHLPR